MSTDCISCNIRRSSRFNSSNSAKVKSLVDHSLNTRLINIGTLKPDLAKRIGVRGVLTVESNFKSKDQMSFGLYSPQRLDSNIRGYAGISGVIRGRVSSDGELKNKYVDKFAGPCDSLKQFENFQATEKLYPEQDVITSLSGNYFVDKNLNTNNLYSSIDEGVSLGNYVKEYKTSTRISDEKTSYIQPSSILTDGEFRYKFEVTTPTQVAKESFLFIRASAPIANYISHVPPKYTLHNIKLEDPSGNLIVKYKDIVIRGDANYNTNYSNFATYISEPEINNLLLNTWDKNYPLMEEASGYTLNIDLTATCLDDPFNEGFNFGYEYDCDASGNKLLLPQNRPNNLTNNLRISSIEISNSGGLGILRDNYLNFYSEVSPVGQRIARTILPCEILSSTFDTGIYPSISTEWRSHDGSISNITTSGAKKLTNILANDSSQDYITLYNSDIANSGKLNLKFSHTPPKPIVQYVNGAFSFGNDSFDAAELENVAETDNFFIIDSIELKVTAKKAIGSRDYVLDIVGYSDDKLLNITPAVGGFLQNISGSGSIPLSSGFNPSDELVISSKPLSDKNSYYESNLTNNDGGDHYKLATLPVVNSTTFADYIIPLKIYEDTVAVGKSKDYSNSSSFENLFVDIYPIPSGASISRIELIVHYKPSNGLTLHTIGQANKELNYRNVTIFPSSRRSNDSIINAGPDFAPVSLIEDIPHGYKTPNTLKTNYSRRWRGVDGSVVAGPFDPYNFDFSFYKPQLNVPFLDGYFSFNKDTNNNIISDSVYNSTPISGTYVGNYTKISNKGLRFNSTSLFSSPTTYTTIDFTSITGYENHELYGLISDSYDNAVRVSGSTGHINFGNIDTVSGFAIFARFSPDINMSGVGYNLWNSGIIFSKYDSGKNLEFALGYENGKLTGYARASNGSIKKVQDNLNYDEYQYPISVLLTYNDNLSGKLKLYTDNEKSSNNTFHHLRDQSSEFTLYSSNSSLRFGYSQGHGVGINAFITDIGISTYNEDGTNIIDSNAGQVSLLYKQLQAETFFDSLKHKFWNPSESYSKDEFKLWQYIDDNTSDWKLGAFKICSFSPDFDSFTKRVGSDYIIHSLTHNGSGYSSFTNLSLPSSVPLSGVSYHTQIENDFLRFNLSDISENSRDLYSVQPRITKTLPRGYKFVDRAIVVDTIIQHETYNDLVWSNGNIGPKLIVSLYSKNQESVDHPSKVNWGLVNRHTHYLEPSGCWTKLSSTFDFDDLISTEEPWSNFDQDRNGTEFDHKYYSKDIDDMFLQYDLVYPTGSQFSSTIKIHSANIRLENALVQANANNNQLSLVASGEYKSLESVNLYTTALDVTHQPLNLFVPAYVTPAASSVFGMYCSGAFVSSSSMPMYSVTAIGTVDSSYSTNNYAMDYFGSEIGYGPILYTEGRSIPLDEKSINLYTQNLVSSQTSSGNLGMFLKNKPLSEMSNNSINFYLNSNNSIFVTKFPSSSVSLFTNVDDIIPSYENSFNLYVASEDFTVTKLDSSFNLFVMNYLAYNQEASQQTSLSWNSDNVGSNIDVIDNSYASLQANDEIRGVDLICYGSCGGEDSCKEQSVLIHGKVYQAPEDCVDGGIFRAINTYTNLEASGFNTNVGYSGHFYGIRKYTDLVPSSPYKVVVTGKTGSTNYITVPPEIEDIEYDVGNGQSGLKLVADAPYSPSGRSINDQYGRSISIKGDLLAVGSPHHSIDDSNGYSLDDAGTVFLYRRLPAPSGFNWSNNISEHKSPWMLEESLVLPSSYVRDYYVEQDKLLVEGFSPVKQRFWHVGQEGRQFGHSLDLAVNPSAEAVFEDSKQVLVVGGPSSKWTRTFETVQPSSVQIGLMIFTDEFVPTIYNPDTKKDRTYNDIINNIKDKDIIFKYCSNPSVSFDVKLIILEPLLDSTRPSVDFADPKPQFIVKKRIARNKGLVNQERTDIIVSGIKEAFHEAFPYDTNKLNNNIPPIIGLYVDNSRSLGRKSLTPAIDQFIDYFKSYSFASGLKDFYNNPSSGSVAEYIPNFGAAENWIVMSNDVLDHTLDTGRLVSSNQTRFFTSGVGTEFFNPNLGEFNYPPVSGGKVFIFEKESGSWSLIQQIESPTQTYGIPDRFGHAVAISDNAEVIAIGSPYINEACRIYEHKPEEKIRLYTGVESWLSYKSSASGGFGRYRNLLEQIQELQTEKNPIEAGKTIYAQLDVNERYEIRSYYNITEYQNIKNFNYSDISIVGTWGFIREKFLPTSRLGYSVAVNGDGSTVAFGAPTDSLNQWDDGNVYYKSNGYFDPSNVDNINGPIEPSWKSNTNAGAVRVFDSRRYYPHNKVVEYTKFGNLQQSLSQPEEAIHFTYLSGIFQDKNFSKTGFSDVNIPQDAGLAFIITPEVDALSDEIFNNIVNWLSLGDRNLVLVGNDPIWEGSGVYESSNNILNKLLTRLNSRMRLHASRNAYEALASGCSSVENIIPSFVPSNSLATYIKPYTLHGYGAADIKIHFPNYSQKMPCDAIDQYGALLNTDCQLPLIHQGDLRAEWISECSPCLGQPIKYPVNWPLVFSSFTPGCCREEDISIPRFDLAHQEPRPLLAAAEYTQPQTIIYPKVPAVSSLVPVYKNVSYNAGLVFSFEEGNEDNIVQFVWSADSGNYTYLNTNLGSTNSSSRFDKPSDLFDRSYVLQATASSKDVTTRGTSLITNHGNYCAATNFGNNNSKVILVAGTFTESENILYAGVGDNNLNFYVNLASKTIDGEATIAQLNAWTGRTHFKDANANSILKEVLENCGNNVETNINKLYSNHDVCWVADPLNTPSSEELAELVNWLNIGDKKLIITYNNDAISANNVVNLCDRLGVSIKPIFLNVDNTYAKSEVNENNPLIFDEQNSFSQGFGGDTSISSILFKQNYTFIPILTSSPVCYSNPQVVDSKYTTNGFWQLKSGVTKVTFPVVAGSGYKIFIDTVSEDKLETEPLHLYISNVNQQPSLPYPADVSSYNIEDINNDTDSKYLLEPINIGYYAGIKNEVYGFVNHKTINVQAQKDVSEISIYIDANNLRLDNPNDNFVPKTTRLIAISGVSIPIRQDILTKTRKEFDKYVYEITRQEIPETTVIVPPSLREISTDNTKYCSSNTCVGGKEIADGPVVAAQEIEIISPFNAGYARSRITLLSDSSLVQGPCMLDSEGRLSENSINFIRSLYPNTVFSADNLGRQFNIMTKIVSPERGSPQKLYAISGNSGINNLFYRSSPSQSSLSNFSDKESLYDPRYVLRPLDPWSNDTPPSEVEAIKKREISTFASLQDTYGATAKFSGIIEGKIYTDIDYLGGMPELMKDKGYDYLDFERFPSGYPGDLFGYSISMHKNKLVVGSPFSAFSSEDIHPWSYYVSGGSSSGTRIGYNGGAGSVYIFEQTFNGSGIRGTKTPWEFTHKLRPSSINVGSGISGSSIVGDQFGHDVDIHEDFIVVGAPGHDFENYVIINSGAFAKKFFNHDFDYKYQTTYDLGSQDIRNQLQHSGNIVTNNGAIFTFENRVIDWPTKKQKWTYVAKSVGDGYNSRSNDSINSFYGKSVSVNMAGRSDSDYTIAAGSPYHKYATSGNHTSSQPMNNAGASYLLDVMLREQPASTANPDSFISARVFGETSASGQPAISLYFKNNKDNNLLYSSSGIIYSNNRGEIFLEASGQDPATKGFAQHRPYILAVDGLYVYGTPTEEGLRLSIVGKVDNDGIMNMYTNVDDSSFVYSTLGLYTGSITGFASGIPSGLCLFTDCPDPTVISNSGLTLFASGIGSNTDTLNMRIRGK